MTTDVPFRILPRVTDSNRHFWTGGEVGELRFLRCKDCGYYIHPPIPICPIDHSKNVAPVRDRIDLAQTYTTQFVEQALKTQQQ